MGALFQGYSRSLSNLAYSLYSGQILFKLGMQLWNFILFHKITQNEAHKTFQNHYRVESTNYMGDFHWFKKCRVRGTAILKVRLSLIGSKISKLLFWGILLKYYSFVINCINMINFKDIWEGLGGSFRSGGKFQNS